MTTLSCYQSKLEMTTTLVHCHYYPVIVIFIYIILFSFPPNSVEKRVHWVERVSPFIHLSQTITHCVCVLVAQSSPTPCDPTDCSLPGSSVHGILQAQYQGLYINEYKEYGSSPLTAYILPKITCCFHVNYFSSKFLRWAMLSPHSGCLNVFFPL